MFKIKSLVLYLISFILGALLMGLIVNKLFNTPLNKDYTEPTLIEVKKGETFKSISHKLEDKHLIKHWWSVYLLTKIVKEEDKTKLQKLHIGEYKISASLTPKEILNKFLSGDVVFYDITIPEGSTLKDISKIITESKLTTKEDIESVLYKSKQLSRALRLNLGLSAKSFEGYLFPETYKFSRPIKAESIVTKMYKEGQSRITDKMKRRAQEIGMSIKDIINLASIIEKETGNSKERATISSVFHNRLRIGMPLQSDPTVIYGIPNFSGNLTKQDLRRNSPYNTYVNKGLPFTPICNPGIESIKAALYPDSTEYVYFVSKNDGSGTHYFSKTYKEHKKAVQVFQLGKSPELLMKEIESEKKLKARPKPKPTPVKQKKKLKKRAKKRFKPISQLDPVRTHRNSGTEGVKRTGLVDPSKVLGR